MTSAVFWTERHVGIVLYKDGERIGIIPHDKLPALQLSIARSLMHRPYDTGETYDDEHPHNGRFGNVVHDP